MLQKENNELNTELLICKQQLAQHAIEDIQRFVFDIIIRYFNLTVSNLFQI